MTFGTLTLANSTVSGNSADVGGGVANYGYLTVVQQSTISGNSADFGGGIANSSQGTARVLQSTISGNSAGFGGAGVFNDGGGMSLIDITVSGNSSVRDGGGVHNSGILSLIQSTISRNTASRDGGGVINDCESSLTLTETLVSGNKAINQGPELLNRSSCEGDDGTINADAHNLFGHDGLAGVVNYTPGESDLVPNEPLAAILDATLANNGGNISTHALIAGSPAIDAIPESECSTTIDQRGVPRPKDGDGDTIADCDIGAFELFPASITPPVTPPITPPVTPTPVISPVIPPTPPVTPVLPPVTLPVSPPVVQPLVQLQRPVAQCTSARCKIQVVCSAITQCVNLATITVRKKGKPVIADGILRTAALDRARRVVIASGVSNVPSGSTGTIQLRFNERGRQLAKVNSGKKVKARLTITGGPSAGVSNTPIKLKIRK